VDLFDRLVTGNQAYVDGGRHRALPVRPAAQLAIVTCMDSRIDVFAAVDLPLGDAHVVRTAGARVTDDVLRSLALSTHALGTRNVMLVGHTDCGLSDPDGTLEQRMAATMGRAPRTRAWHAFTDVRQAVADDCRVLTAWPDRPDGFRLAGYVFDVEDGRLHEVVPPTSVPDPT
jgi:carbonic anhydrase